MGHTYFFLGTKAQVIKMGPVIRAFRERSSEYSIVLTGQHRETIDEILYDFGIGDRVTWLYDGPEITDVIGTMGWTIRIFLRILSAKDLFDKEGSMVVHGDTLSTLYGAIIGVLKGYRVFHIEAGYRSRSLLNPFPEELLRILTSKLAQIHFCPGKEACTNLGGKNGIIDTQTNTVHDSLRFALGRKAVYDLDVPQNFGVCTFHRFENIYSRKTLGKIISIVEDAAKTMHMVVVTHQPTKKKLIEYGLLERLERNPRIILTDRMPYIPFIQLMGKSKLVLSDGGGNQEECSFLGKPILILRKKTERHDGLGENALLCGFDAEIAGDFIRRYGEFSRPPFKSGVSPSEIIVDYLFKD